jgi:hypothetical protein
VELEQLKIDRGTGGARPRRKRMSGWTKLLILGAMALLFRVQRR